MLYDMRCDTCKRILEIGCSMNQHEDIIVPGIDCSQHNCYGTMYQVITPTRQILVKGGFPGTGNEVELPTNHGEDVKFSDKHHAKDWLGERGLMSKWIENDM